MRFVSGSKISRRNFVSFARASSGHLDIRGLVTRHALAKRACDLGHLRVDLASLRLQPKRLRNNLRSRCKTLSPTPWNLHREI